MTSPFEWMGKPSIFAAPEHCTQSQASEIAQAKRMFKKPGKSVQLANSAPKASNPAMLDKPKCTWGGAQPGAGRPALDLDLPAMRAYRALGKTWAQVANEFGCSTFTARTKCKTVADVVAKILRDNTNSRYCTPIGNQAGTDKSQKIRGKL
jgi:hypothetical protein